MAEVFAMGYFGRTATRRDNDQLRDGNVRAIGKGNEEGVFPCVGRFRVGPIEVDCDCPCNVEATSHDQGSFGGVRLRVEDKARGRVNFQSA